MVLRVQSVAPCSRAQGQFAESKACGGNTGYGTEVTRAQEETGGGAFLLGVRGLVNSDLAGHWPALLHLKKRKWELVTGILYRETVGLLHVSPSRLSAEQGHSFIYPLGTPKRKRPSNSAACPPALPHRICRLREPPGRGRRRRGILPASEAPTGTWCEGLHHQEKTEDEEEGGREGRVYQEPGIGPRV